MSDSVACIDYRDGKIFIAKRQKGGDMGGRWEFPGGKIDSGENYQQAIKREMNEEFSVDVDVFEKIGFCQFEHKGKTCTVQAFKVHFAHDGIEKKFVLTEHTDYKWVFPSEIKKLNFVDSDLKLLPEVFKNLGIKEDDR